MCTEKYHQAVVTVAAVIWISASAVFAAEPAAPAQKPSIAKICTNCHKAEPNAVRGYFDNVAFKARTIQIRIDDAVELITFDEDEIKVVNGEGTCGDGELLKDNGLKKGHEVKIEYVEKNGVKTAVKLTAKQPVTVPAELLINSNDIEKLVALGPEKGGYFLFDSRPLPRFQEGAIPTAVNLPFPAFDKMADKLLPNDKNSLVIFYCSGPTCSMSPGSADKSRKLGYTNIRVYKDGMPAWSVRNYGVLSVQSLAEAWINKDIPHVLLDVRAARESAKGFIKGAVAFPSAKAAKLIKGLPAMDKKMPVIIYDAGDGSQAVKAAKELLKAGYGNVKLLTGGFEGWKRAGFPVASGKLASKATYVPKPRQGEINLDEFRQYAADLPASVMIIDVRNPDEGDAGMLKGARLIPAEEIKNRSAEIPRDKMVVTYCSTGIRAEMAYHALKELGYTNVRFVNAKMEFEKSGVYRITKE